MKSLKERHIWWFCFRSH